MNRTLGDVAEVFHLYDVHQEEKVIEKAIINDDEDIWAKLATLGMGSDAEDSQTNAEEKIPDEKPNDIVTIGKTDDSEVEVKIDEGISIYKRIWILFCTLPTVGERPSYQAWQCDY